MYTSMSDMLKEAQRERYAVGYFESWNLESTRAVVKAAEEARSPLFVGFNGGFLDEHGYNVEYYASIGKVAVDSASVPAALLLNEVSGFKQVVQAIRLGFNAVMIDLSLLPFEEAVEQAKSIVETSHLANVSVEAQFDSLPAAKKGAMEEVSNIAMTDPRKAAEFVEKTGVDALSVSIGNVHGLYKGWAHIDFQRLQEIKKIIGTPLVLHGATGISDEDVKKAIGLGVCKINVGHALRLAFAEVIRNSLRRKLSPDLESISDSAEKKMKDLIRNKMKMYGCAGHARELTGS